MIWSLKAYKEAAEARLSLHLSKCYIVGNHMSRLFLYLQSKMALPNGPMEIVFSFDTTGSMCSCLDEVRGRVQDMVQRLQSDIPGIRIAIFAHGDYCDASRYITK